MREPTRELAGTLATIDRRLRAVEGQRLNVAITAREGAVVNIRDYGALGLGLDDRPYIQAAYDAAGDGGIIYWPAAPVHYSLATATIPSETIIRSYPGQHSLGDGKFKSRARISDNFGDYRAVFAMANPSIYSGNWSMHGIGIDQNAVNGNALNIASMATYPRIPIYLGSYVAGSSVEVTDCGFFNCDNVNTVYAYADTIDVSRNQFLATGIGAAGVHDHSTIYTTTTVAGGTQTIEGNTFRGAQTGGATAAIETHGGTQVVNGNVISGYMAGGNLTGVGTVATLGITCSDNQVYGCLIGFTFYVAYTAGLPSGIIARNYVFTDNVIIIDRDLWDAIAGLSPIAGGILAVMADAALYGLRITGNEITFLPATTFTNIDNNCVGIKLVSTATIIIYDLRVEDNTIYEPLAAGIRIDQTIDRGSIKRNHTINPRVSTDAVVATVYGACVMIGHTIIDVDFEANKLTDTRGTHRADYCIYLNPTVATDCTSRDNKTRLVDGATSVTPTYPAANTAGVAVRINDTAPSDIVTFFNALTGSEMENRVTGRRQRQVTATAGTAWKDVLGLGLTTTTTAPAAGGAGALPATPTGYVTENINGTDRKVAYY